MLCYAFGSGTAWAYEIAAMLLPWLAAEGVMIAATRRADITVTRLRDLAGPGVGRALAIAAQVAVLSICLGAPPSSRLILRASQCHTLSTLGIRRIWG